MVFKSKKIKTLLIKQTYLKRVLLQDYLKKGVKNMEGLRKNVETLINDHFDKKLKDVYYDNEDNEDKIESMVDELKEKVDDLLRSTDNSIDWKLEEIEANRYRRDIYADDYAAREQALYDYDQICYR